MLRRGGGAKRSIWDNHLDPSEEILWEGQPGFGIKPSLTASKEAGTAIIAIGGLLFYTRSFGVSFSRQMGGLENYVTLDTLLYIGLGWSILWLIYTSLSLPFGTRYALTRKHAYIAKTFPITRIRSYPITTETPLEYDGSSRGTIIFAERVTKNGNNKIIRFPVGFLFLRDAKKVYQLMREIQARTL